MIVPADQFVSEVKRNTDIVSLIKQQTELKLSSGSWVGLCPFHDEKTPSFRVYPDSQTFHCYGCHRHGDVFAFLMEQTGCDFAQALATLGRQANIEQERTTSYSSGEKHRQKLRARDQLAMETTQNWYIDQLQHTREGSFALKWLGNRGISANMVERFKLGYAPFNFEPSTTKLASDGRKLLFGEFYEHELVRTGVLIKKEQDHYPLLRNRIIFPIHDYQGKCIAFSGRRFDGKSNYKYVNTKTTEIFEKGEVIYGLHLAKPHKDHGLVVTEGNTDVIAMHQFGLSFGVACLGTATTPAHARVLAQRTNKLVLAFDADPAGLKAVFRTLNIFAPLLGERLGVKILLLGKGEDPDSFIHKNGVAPFEQKIKSAMTVSKFFITQYQEKPTVEEKSSYLTSLRVFFGHIKDTLYRELLVQDLAQVFKVSVAVLFPADSGKSTHQLTNSANIHRPQSNSANIHRPQSNSTKFDNSQPPEFDEIPEAYIDQIGSTQADEQPTVSSSAGSESANNIVQKNFYSLLGISKTLSLMMERKNFFEQRDKVSDESIRHIFKLSSRTLLILDLLNYPERLARVKLQENYANSEYYEVVDNVITTKETADIYKSYSDEKILFAIASQIFAQEKTKLTSDNYDSFVDELAKLLCDTTTFKQKIKQQLKVRYRKK